jgi:hypothetical protein
VKTAADPVFGPRIPFYRCAASTTVATWSGLVTITCGAEIRWGGQDWFHATHYSGHEHDVVAPEGASPDLPAPEE